MITRRTKLSAAVAVLTGLLGFPALSADKITVVSWGGSYAESQRHAFYEPFTKDTSITVLEDEWGGDMAKIKAMVDTQTYQGNVFDAESAHLVSGCDQGLWEHIDYSKLAGDPGFEESMNQVTEGSPEADKLKAEADKIGIVCD